MHRLESIFIPPIQTASIISGCPILVVSESHCLTAMVKLVSDGVPVEMLSAWKQARQRLQEMPIATLVVDLQQPLDADVEIILAEVKNLPGVAPVVFFARDLCLPYGCPDHIWWVSETSRLKDALHSE